MQQIINILLNLGLLEITLNSTDVFIIGLSVVYIFGRMLDLAKDNKSRNLNCII